MSWTTLPGRYAMYYHVRLALRATLLCILTLLATHAVAPYIEGPPAPALPPAPAWKPMRMCFWESHNDNCDFTKSAALGCTKLEHGQCCGHDEDGWCGSMSGEGVPPGNMFEFYKTNTGHCLWDRCLPGYDCGPRCSLPGSCANNGKELERCSIRWERRDGGDYGTFRPPTYGVQSKRDVCVQPDLAHYHDPLTGLKRHIRIPEERVRSVAGLIKREEWELLATYETFPPEHEPRVLLALAQDAASAGGIVADEDVLSELSSDSDGQ